MNLPATNRHPIVLYVEDSVDDRELMRSAAKVSHVKFALALADGYSEAVDYLGGERQYADRTRYPLATFVLLDYALGTLKGVDLVRWIRKQSGISSLPVVMFSGCTEVPEMAECYAAGADYCIKKPLRTEDLLKVVRGLDVCLEHNPPLLAALADVAADPTLERQALTAALKQGLADNRALREQAQVRIAKLDLTMAVRKEVVKNVPFARKTGQEAEALGADRLERP